MEGVDREFGERVEECEGWGVRVERRGMKGWGLRDEGMKG